MIIFNDDEERAKTYKLFSDIFISEPSDDLIRKTAESLEINVNETGFEIRMDYIQLFSNAAGQLLPYESLYNYEVWEVPKIWGRTTVEVSRMYLDAGLDIDEEIDIVPDHISAELLFMSYLIENDKKDLQKLFLEEHICVWIPDFCDDVIEFAQTNFYREVAGMLKELIMIDCGEIKLKSF